MCEYDETCMSDTSIKKYEMSASEQAELECKILCMENVMKEFNIMHINKVKKRLKQTVKIMKNIRKSTEDYMGLYTHMGKRALVKKELISQDIEGDLQDVLTKANQTIKVLNIFEGKITKISACSNSIKQCVYDDDYYDMLEELNTKIHRRNREIYIFNDVVNQVNAQFTLLNKLIYAFELIKAFNMPKVPTVNVLPFIVNI